MTFSRLSFIFCNCFTNSSFISIIVSVLSFFIFFSSWCVNGPVPGPSSTMCCASLKSIGASIAFVRSGPLGIIAPVVLGLRIACLMNFHIVRQRFLISY